LIESVVRFLGRKVYVEGAIVIACVLVPLIEQRARAIREATGIAARTVRRWQTWWKTVFTASALWVEVRSRAQRAAPASPTTEACWNCTSSSRTSRSS
jgi:hypothetical protein